MWPTLDQNFSAKNKKKNPPLEVWSRDGYVEHVR